jgi:UDP-3-O-[3-hydroxymyristoyl] glucosamine N-acyltransferase
LAGSTTIGRYVMMAGASGSAGHLEIGDKVVVLGMSMVTQSISEPGEYGAGIPAQEAGVWRRNLAALRRLGRRRSRE